MFRGLRNKFILMHMGTVTLLVLLFFGTLLALNYRQMQRTSDEMLRRNSEISISPGDMPPINMGPPRNGFRPRFDPIFSVELDDNGNIVNVISAFDDAAEFYEQVTGTALAKKQNTAIIHYDGSTLKYLRVGEGIIFLDISREMQMFTSNIYTFLWIALPLLLVIFLISLYFAKRSIKPIEETYNKQKEFIADASHELKTPLAVISTNVDVLLEGADTEQQKWLGYIKEETERMAGLTASLLFLTKLDYVQEKTSSVIDFSKLIENCLLPMEALFYESKIKTHIDVLPNVKINGDSEQIRRLIGILVDNALKYTNGEIRIALDKSEHNARLTVYNTGKGISAAELPKIWDRFYRGDKSRESTGGFGLGLPIAKSIAEKFKGGLTAESKEDKWTRFILKLPLA